MTFAAASKIAAACVAPAFSAPSWAQRAHGIDVSDWQGNLSLSDWTTIHQPVSQGGGGKDFVFLRSTRGGTTGTYNQSTGSGSLSHRYDDLQFINNITRSTQAGLFAGPYHFARPDILSNTGADEANHMLEIAGPYMTPGYLRPVLDLEAGATQRTRAELSAFAVEFANTIFAAKGIYPLVYINSSYANDEVNSTVTIMDLWIARWPNQADPDAIDTNGDPPAAASYPNVYGVWNPTYPAIPNPTPWKFWQYASTGTVPGISGNVDLDVAHGDIEFVKDFLVPAMWTPNASGLWQTASNWNSNPGLPGPNDRVIIDRPAGVFTITLSSGTHSIRSLQSNEALTINAPLTIQQYARIDNVLSISDSGLVRLTSSGSTSVVQSLSISGSGKLDVGDNNLVIDYSGDTPIQSIRAMLASGSLNSSATDPDKRLVYADNASSGLAVFSGQSVDSTSVLIGFTYTGDANFDAKVDIVDLGLLASARQSGNIGAGADFDYSGAVDIADLGLLASNWQVGVVGASASEPTARPWALDDAVASFGIPSVSIPEPAATTPFGLLGCLAGRRWRKRAMRSDPVRVHLW